VDFWEVVRKRRSVRQYSNQPVDEELVRRIVDAARLAPSGGNCQPWRFFAVFSESKREELVQCTYRRNNPESPPQDWLRQAPVLILVCKDTRSTTEKYDRWGRDFIATQDCAAAVENMLLAATALGLGTCWIGGVRVADVQCLFELPTYLDPFCIVAVGYPAREPGLKPKLGLEDIYTAVK